jgi:hypothetical protein
VMVVITMYLFTFYNVCMLYRGNGNPLKGFPRLHTNNTRFKNQAWSCTHA